MLIVALIIGSFFLGSLTDKVVSLEKNGTTNSVLQAAAPSVPSVTPIPPTAGKIKPVISSDHIRGNIDAKVTLVVYSDFECPFCKTFHLTIQKLLENYGDKIRLVYRHFPLPSHANAQKEAEASECVAQLGGNDAFWKYIDTIFERTTSGGTGFALDKLGTLASEMEIDQQQFQNCLDSGKYEQLIRDQTTDGTAGGVSGTPSTFVINSKGETQLVVGAQPIDAFKTIIDKELTK